MATEADHFKGRIEQYETKIRGKDFDPINDRQDIAILDQLKTATASVERWMRRCEAQEQAMARLRKRLRDRGIDDT